MPVDPFARLIPDARAFVADLSANNRRDWFAGHKDRYEADLKAPALALMDRMAQERGGGLVPKLFRPRRDIRFSRDKTPYHTHLHMIWGLGGTGPDRVALMFGIAPGYVTAGGGAMGFAKPALDLWRRAVDSTHGADLADALERLSGDGFRLDDADLKRVPAPYPADHPRGDLLRRKRLLVWRDLPEPAHRAPLAALHAVFDALQPVLDRLQEIVQPR